jgi:hypothetical protein
LVANQSRRNKELTVFLEESPVAVNHTLGWRNTWQKDTNGKSFIASSWFRRKRLFNKDHMYDE